MTFLCTGYLKHIDKEIKEIKTASGGWKRPNTTNKDDKIRKVVVWGECAKTAWVSKGKVYSDALRCTPKHTYQKHFDEAFKT